MSISTTAHAADSTRVCSGADIRAKLLAAISGRRPGLAIRDGDSMVSLGLDSLDRIALATVLEQATGQPVSDRALAAARTVADLLSCATTSTPGLAPGARLLLPSTPLGVPVATGNSISRPGRPLYGDGNGGSDRGWVDPGGHVGAGTRLWHQAQVASGACVGVDCTLGKGVFVGAGSTIGDRVKIGNGASVFGATVADEVMICPGALLLEDPAPRATTPDGRRKGPEDFTRRPVVLAHGATIGAAAVLAPGVSIGAHALIALGAVVVRNVPAHALVAGNPARQCGWVCRCGHTLDDQHRCPVCARTYIVDGDQLAEAGLDLPVRVSR